MKKARKLAAALGLITLPMFTGAWTLPQAQQQEEPIEAAAITTVGQSYGSPVVMSTNETIYMSHGYNEYIAGSSNIRFTFYQEQAGWFGTDRIKYYFNLNTGPNFQVKIKTLYFWGSNTMVHGSEVITGPFTVGSGGYEGTLWCDHGGIPESSEQSNKAWNCNFAVISMQVKSNSVRTETFVIDWCDSGDNFDEYVLYNLEEFYSMLTPWGAW